MLTNFDSYLKIISNLFKQKPGEYLQKNSRYCESWLKNRLNQSPCKNFSSYDELVIRIKCGLER